MERREVLVGCGTFFAGLITGLAVGPDGDAGATRQTQTPTDTPTPTPTPTDTPTPTPAPTDTPTPVDTPTPTPTDTPTPVDTPTPMPAFTDDGTIHSLGDRFTVGTGGRAITYRLVEFYRAAELGTELSKSTAEGVYLVVVVEVTNPRDSIIALPRDDFRLQSRELNAWIRFDGSASEQLDNDNRIDTESLVSTGINSGETVIGAVAFDVESDTTYWVWMTPDGGEDTPEHFVRVGNVSELERL
jgi:hypothetical protein